MFIESIIIMYHTKENNIKQNMFFFPLYSVHVHFSLLYNKNKEIYYDISEKSKEYFLILMIYMIFYISLTQ